MKITHFKEEFERALEKRAILMQDILLKKKKREN
jgi:hypothetical protein